MVGEPAGDPGPDWGAIDFQPVCPLCEYELRGLREPRCPECGYRFTWAELIDPERRRHPYLFEHYPKRNLWSFGKTLWNAQRPRRFWKTLKPQQASRVRRLLIYALAVNGIIGLMLVGGIGVSFVTMMLHRVGFNARLQAQEMARLNDPNAPPDVVKMRDQIIALNGSVQKYLDSWLPTTVTTYLRHPVYRSEALKGLAFMSLAPLCIALAWPWLTFLSLQVFRISMGRARIRTSHVLRCVVYSADVFLWGALLGLPLVVASRFVGPSIEQYFSRPLWAISTSIVSQLWPLLAIVIFLVWCYRLTTAYREYLRFDHAVATIVASQVIVVLSVASLGGFVLFFVLGG